MKSRILQIMFNIRYSYWFIPSLMALAAIALAMGMVVVDVYYITEIPAGFEWLFRSQPDGARAILSTVAGSTITVAGVVFSMTIMSVSHATANYGSRLLLNFLNDRANQFALGTFTATFIYCLLVLRTVSNSGSAGDFTGFVPHAAILVALGLALASVAVLIAFIHHVPDSIHIGEVASDRGRDLVARLDTLFPETSEDDVSLDQIKNDDQHARTVVSESFGYIQTLDVDGLVRFASQEKLTIHVLKFPGDFLYAGETIYSINSDSPSRDAEGVQYSDRALRKFYAVGNERTPSQDVRFLIEELVQISARALSPGINDPFTASTCIDWLGNGLAHIMGRRARSSILSDDDGNPRVCMPRQEFDDIANTALNPLRGYVAADTVAVLHIGLMFRQILSCGGTPENQRTINEHAAKYFESAMEKCVSKVSRERIRDCFSTIINTDEESPA